MTNVKTTFSFTGVVKSVKPLDYELVKEYRFPVQAKDWKYNTVVQAIVKVININDNSPVFTVPQYTITIPEDTALKSRVLTVKATDEDPFGELVYSLESSDSKLPFSVESRTGNIAVAGYLDRETKAEYSFKVKV